MQHARSWHHVDTAPARFRAPAGAAAAPRLLQLGHGGAPPPAAAVAVVSRQQHASRRRSSHVAAGGGQVPGQPRPLSELLAADAAQPKQPKQPPPHEQHQQWSDTQQQHQEGAPAAGAAGNGSYGGRPTAAVGAAAAAAAALATPPYRTSAAPFEAFEPGDTGFTAPSSGVVVTSSSGSVMVKFTAHFSGELGDRVLVCGPTRALGNWEPDAAPALTWGEGDAWTATLELMPGTHEFKCVAVKADPLAPLVWEPGNNRRVVVARPAGSPDSSGEDIDLVLGLLQGEEADAHPEAQLVETAGGTTMVKLTTTYTAAFGEYLKVVGGAEELGAWDAGAAPALTWGEGDVWTATLELPAGEHAFKYVVVRQDGRLEWEPGENRCIHVPPPGLAAALAAAKQVVAAEDAAGGSRSVSPSGRRLSPAEVYARHEATEQLEPWQIFAVEEAARSAAVSQTQADSQAASDAQTKQAAADAHAKRAELQQQRLTALFGENRQRPQPREPARTAPVPAAAAAGAGAVAPCSSSGPPAAAAPPPPLRPSGWREVKFSVTHKAEFGTFLKVVGGLEQLGAWELEAAPPLQWSEGDVWSNTLLLPPGRHEFKLVLVFPNGTATWEADPNRLLDVAAATNRASEAGGVLSVECTFGKTEATSSVWATVEDEEEEPAAAAPGAPQLLTAKPESWYSEQQREEAAADTAADAAAAEERAAFKRQLEQPPPQPAAPQEPQPPARVLQPLDAVVKVFKERFIPWSTSPAASPAASRDDKEAEAAPAAAAAAAAGQDEEEQEEQQRQPPAADTGSRFAAIIAARKDQPPQEPAVAFVDRRRNDSDSDNRRSGQQQQMPWERSQPQQQQQQPGAPDGSSSSGGGGGGRFDSIIAAQRQQQQSAPTPPWEQRPDEPQQQQQRDGGGSGERFAAQIARARSRSSSPEPTSYARDQQQQQQPERSWRNQQPDEQQQPAAGGSERFAAQIGQIRSRPDSPPPRQASEARWERQQAPEPQQEQHRERQQAPSEPAGGSGSERFAAQISQIRSRPDSPPPRQASEARWERQQAPEPQQEQHRERQQAPSEPAGGSGSERFAAQISQIRSRPDSPPPRQASEARWERQQAPEPQQEQHWERQQAPSEPAGGSGSERFAAQISQIRSRPSSPDPAPARHEAPRQQQQQQQEQRWAEASPRSSWRSSPTASPAPAAEQQRQPTSSSGGGERFANWRSASPRPESQQQQQQEREERSSSSSPSWRSGAGSSYTSYDASSGSDEDDAQPPSRGSWRSPSPPLGRAEAQEALRQAESAGASGRFSKYTSGSGWSRSSSPTPPPLPSADANGDERSSSGAAAAGGSPSPSEFRSSWDAKEAGGGRGGGADYLFELGQSDYNTNVDAGQNRDMIDSLFTGNVLGHRSDIADGSLRGYELRTFNHLVGDYYIAPSFMDKVTMHITKNYLCDQAAISKGVKVPLVLGIWGPKGCGKTFQTELAFKKLGVEPVVMSAGELESEVAGQPGRLIRERYRKASELSKVRGKLSCLVINDLDAGIGRFGNTQVTVNNQIVIGTLMNICDDPNRVSIGANWRESDTIRRVPIIVTGNDFSTLYAPLIRDGRMEKFYWQPTREEVVNIVWQMYKEDGLSRRDIERLVETYSHQALDFFGALRAATYDGQIKEWMVEVAGGELAEADPSGVKEMNARLLAQKGLPEFEPVPLTLDMLVAEGDRLVAEQDLVNSSKLGEEYMKGVNWATGDKEGGGGGGVGLGLLG